jgi:hypothetical protein
MKILFRFPLLSFLSLILAGCIGSNQHVPVLPIYTTPTSTSTLVIPETIQLPTATRRPTATLTVTLTPVQIPKSTFDASKAITQTPFPAARCTPDGSKTALPDLDTLNQSRDFFENTIVEILNAGGIQSIVGGHKETDGYAITLADLTHDGVPELITENGYKLPGFLSVFGCDGVQYKKMLTVDAAYDYAPSVMQTSDMNLNGMPDLALVLTTCHWCTGVLVYEWDGQAFQSLIREWFIDTSLNELHYSSIAELVGYADAEIVDAYGNGTYEIILRGGLLSNISDSYTYGPFRSTIKTFMWDGQYYSKYRQKYSPPEFRFQAIQDGDDASLYGDYDEALAFYQDAFFNDKLKGWSAEEKENQIAHVDVLYTSSPTPTSLPPHYEDYDPIAAYARYRIMLLHILRGYQKEAQVVYDTLQELFPEGNMGHPYTEMAQLFWFEYSNSKNVKLACQQAINYANAHQEILVPLNGPESSFWSRQYVPGDICPFE